MNHRIFKILSFVIKEIQKNSIEDIDLNVIVEALEDRGFSEDEIATAISWLGSKDEVMDAILYDTGGSLPRPVWRQLNDMEQHAISPSAYSYLFHLREMQILADHEMEMVIERAVKLDIPQIGVEDMQDLIAIIVLDFESTASEGFFQFTSNQLPH
jgi:uncharacterized protein Smg (DUF494 family)